MQKQESFSKIYLQDTMMKLGLGINRVREEDLFVKFKCGKQL